jgi:hypothetical protein
VAAVHGRPTACRRDESALETSRHRDFTTIVTTLLHGGIPAVANQEFQSRLVASFGAASDHSKGIISGLRRRFVAARGFDVATDSVGDLGGARASVPCSIRMALPA